MMTDIASVDKIVSIFDYRYVILSQPLGKRRERGFFMGVGGQNVYRSETLNNPQWEQVGRNFELPPDTLLYGEFVDEIGEMSYDLTDEKMDYKRQKMKTAFHIIDAIFLHGFNISKFHLTARHDLLQKFCLSVNKLSRPDLIQLRVKTLLRLEEAEKAFAHPHFAVRSVKVSGHTRVMYCEDRKGAPHYHVPAYGIMFLRMTRG